MARLSRSQLVALSDAIDDIVMRQQTSAFEGLSPLQIQELDFQKWRLIHKRVHGSPFHTNQRLKRSDQWRAALGPVRDIKEPEVLDWAIVQIEIAGNLERGIPDMRPRKNGPCHPLVLEYVANRKRKALAVLHFTKASEEQGAYGVNSAFHSKTAEILNEKFPEDKQDSQVGHEEMPWRPRRR
jgi:hypothetical protein